MALLLVGLNHKSAPLEVRERLSYAPDALPDVLRSLRSRDVVSECAALCTCNRTELYVVSSEPDRCDEVLNEFLNSNHLYSHRERSAVEHLFSVSSGIDSMVLGENQILGQVRQAYVTAQQAHTTGPVLDKLFPWALKVGKLARSQTRICQGAASVAAAAIELSSAVFGELRGRSVLLLGAGKMTQAALNLLQSSGVKQISVVNRTYERANELAARCGGQAVPFEDLDRGLAEADLLISSTGAPHYVVTRERLEKIKRLRRGRPLLLVDIAVPRDIEPSCAQLENVYLYNIDDLQQVVADNLSRRHAEVNKVLEIVRTESDQFLRDLDSRRASGAIQIMRGGFEQIRDQELNKFLSKHHVSEEEAERMRQFSQQLLNKLLHQPTQRLKQLGGAGVDVEELSRTLELLGLSSQPDRFSVSEGSIAALTPQPSPTEIP